MKDAQILVRADGGGEGGVIFNSALSLLQGLFPATDNYNTTLANGTNVVGPLGGYQTVPSTVLFPCIVTMLTDNPVESVEPSNDVSLEGWTSCNVRRWIYVLLVPANALYCRHLSLR